MAEWARTWTPGEEAPSWNGTVPRDGSPWTDAAPYCCSMSASYTTVRLEGSRITLREFVPEDWSAVHEWASRADACRYEAWGPNNPEETRAHLRSAIAVAAARPRMHYVLAAVLRETGRVVGSGTLSVRGERLRSGEIAYIVHPDYWGRGPATEIAGLLLYLGFGRLGLHRVSATCDPRNVGSARVLRKVGMIHEGRHRHTLLIRDGWRDSDVYSILEHEWSTADGDV